MISAPFILPSFFVTMYAIVITYQHFFVIEKVIYKRSNELANLGWERMRKDYLFFDGAISLPMNIKVSLKNDKKERPNFRIKPKK